MFNYANVVVVVVQKYSFSDILVSCQLFHYITLPHPIPKEACPQVILLAIDRCKIQLDYHPGGGGGTLIYGLDRYVPPDRVQFLRVLIFNTVSFLPWLALHSRCDP